MNCDNCGKRFEKADTVRALVLGKYHPDTDEICGVEVIDIIKINHIDCDNPKKELDVI